VGDIMMNESANESEQKIKAIGRSRNVSRIRALRDGSRLDIDTRLAKPEEAGDRMHNAEIV